LTGKVKTALSLSRRVPAASINVDTLNEVVTLKGEVPNEGTRQLAEMITRDTTGVNEVRNELTVNPQSAAQSEMDRMRNRVGDLEEQYLVHDAILKHPDLIGEDVNVTVMNHAVTLTGSVETAEQKYIAEQVASSIEGVKSVNNQLRLNYPAN
jgi:osmotically-inducible protein OsmY